MCRPSLDSGPLRSSTEEHSYSTGCFWNCVLAFGLGGGRLGTSCDRLGGDRCRKLLVCCAKDIGKHRAPTSRGAGTLRTAVPNPFGRGLGDDTARGRVRGKGHKTPPHLCAPADCLHTGSGFGGLAKCRTSSPDYQRLMH